MIYISLSQCIIIAVGIRHRNLTLHTNPKEGFYFTSNCCWLAWCNNLSLFCRNNCFRYVTSSTVTLDLLGEQNTAIFHYSNSYKTRHAPNYHTVPTVTEILTGNILYCSYTFGIPPSSQHHQGLLCFLVFIAEEADGVGDKGSGDTTTVDADNEDILNMSLGSACSLIKLSLIKAKLTVLGLFS